jgi:hypothetical protein
VLSRSNSLTPVGIKKDEPLSINPDSAVISFERRDMDGRQEGRQRTRHLSSLRDLTKRAAEIERPKSMRNSLPRTQSLTAEAERSQTPHERRPTDSRTADKDRGEYFQRLATHPPHPRRRLQQDDHLSDELASPEVALKRASELLVKQVRRVTYHDLGTRQRAFC